MAGSSSNQYASVREIPYPSNLSAASFVSVKLSGRDNYHMWKAQMLCLLDIHDMLHFINDCNVPKEGDDSYRLWRRSNAVVKGWIIGSLTEETLRYVSHCLGEKINQAVDANFNAKSLWDELQNIYNPPLVVDFPEAVREEIEEDHYRLVRQVIQGNYWVLSMNVMEEKKVTVYDKINSNGNTAIHVAASTTKKPIVLQKFLELISEDERSDIWTNYEGHTPLHVAAIVGNSEAAEMLVKKYPSWLSAKDKRGQTPLAIARSNADAKMLGVLLHPSNTDIEKDTPYPSGSDDERIVIHISSRDFRSAIDLVDCYERYAADAVLMALAQYFPNELNIVEKNLVTSIIRRRLLHSLRSVRYEKAGRCVPFCGSWFDILFTLFLAGVIFIIMFFMQILKMLAWPFIIKRVRIYADARKLLSKVCKLIKNKEWVVSPDNYQKSIFEATRKNAYEVVEDMVLFDPSLIRCKNQDGHNIFQNAVINRSEKVYNLLYWMSEHKSYHRTIEDHYQNNLLHLAGRLAPAYRLELISGAFLQLQSELQWFKEVQGFVSPLTITKKNFFNETPHMVFEREHKELMIEGEKWLKATAESYTITAALITTIVFAAAITVPGGSNQDTGIPVLTNKTAFAVFAISDAISLFASITSLLMFMSILTARFAEQDFLFKLPTKLIIGLVTLFISTTAMIVASGATLYLVFGQNNSEILTTIIVFTCVPIVAFVILQSRLIIDLLSATYGRSIFGKKNDRPPCDF